MDHERFDALTRDLTTRPTRPTRRTLLGGLVGGVAALIDLTVPGTATAHNLRTVCRTLPDPAKRRRCLNRAREHKRRCHSIAPAVTCAGRCGTWPDQCGKAVSCAVCAAPKLCLSNGSCGQSCSGTSCPTDCKCLPRNPLVEGGTYCLSNNVTCATALQPCSATAACPVGQACLIMDCATPSNPAANRCVPLC